MTGDRRGRRLVLVRHAKSSWDQPDLADHDRPLAPRGRKAVRRMRDHLESLGARPDIVLCSSARRTSETLDGIRDAFGSQPRVEIEPALYGAGAHELLGRLVTVDDEVRCVALIGHNPGMADLVELLAARGDEAPAVDAFPTGAIAVLSFTGPWRGLGPAVASLESFWQPRKAR